MSKNKNKRDQASTQNEAPFKKYEKPLTCSEFTHWLYQELKNTNKKSMTELICNSTHDWVDYKGDRIHILITTEAVNKEKTSFDYVIKARKYHPGEKVGINLESGNLMEFVRSAKSVLYGDIEDDDNIASKREITWTFDYKKTSIDDLKLLFFELTKEAIRTVEKEHLTEGEVLMTLCDEEMRVAPLTIPLGVHILKKLKKVEREKEFKNQILLAITKILEGKVTDIK